MTKTNKIISEIFENIRDQHKKKRTLQYVKPTRKYWDGKPTKICETNMKIREFNMKPIEVNNKVCDANTNLHGGDYKWHTAGHEPLDLLPSFGLELLDVLLSLRIVHAHI